MIFAEIGMVQRVAQHYLQALEVETSSSEEGHVKSCLVILCFTLMYAFFRQIALIIIDSSMLGKRKATEQWDSERGSAKSSSDCEIEVVPKTHRQGLEH